MSFFRESVAAVLLVILTLWMHCAGLAALIFWVRRAVTGDLHEDLARLAIKDGLVD